MSAAAIFGIGIAVGKGRRVPLIHDAEQEKFAVSQGLSFTPEEVVIDPATLSFPKELLAETPTTLTEPLTQPIPPNPQVAAKDN